MSKQDKLEELKKAVKSYPDFPKPGIIFWDLFSILSNPSASTLLKEILIDTAKTICPPVEVVVGLDARGFLLGPLISLELNIPFVPIRKKGKLPGKVQSYKYELEYGEATVEIQEESIKAGQIVLVVDDLLATGGTLGAACELVKKLGGTVSKCLVVMELPALNGRKKIPADVISLMEF
ncbi:adenine phosphoribosyltransferase [Sitophilus oryzae]|uniref:Adenine phosphoribosyltransferase n=1 Tax=Sitophilus oryzae TaxID=7048 RepID=A0A6J2XWE1_SITOR|nr:adenine phosphoribosyltransferase [Sitophilus oryzae]